MSTGPTGPDSSMDTTGPTGPDSSMDTTGPTGPTYTTIPQPLNPVPLPAPNPIASLSELTNSHNAIVQRENRDRSSLYQLTNPNRGDVRTALLSWTSRGFPPNFTIFSVSVTPPPVCSDGVRRLFGDYVEYLLVTSITSKLTLLQPLLVGMIISYRITGNNLYIQVSKE